MVSVISNHRKRRPAAAAGDGVRVFDLEFRADESLIEAHGRSGEEGQGDGVRHHGIGEDCVVLARLVGKRERNGESWNLAVGQCRAQRPESWKGGEADQKLLFRAGLHPKPLKTTCRSLSGINTE